MASVNLQGLAFDFCDAWYDALSQGRVVQGYLSVHRERCVSYQDLHRAEAAEAEPQIQEAVQPLIAQERKEYEDSAPEPPGTFKCEVCGEEAKISGSA